MVREQLSWFLLIALLLFGVILATANLFVMVISVLLLVFAGILFGIFIHGVSNWPAAHTRLSYRFYYVTVVVCLLAIIGIGLYYLGAQVAQRADQFWAELQQSIEQANARLNQFESLEQYLPSAEQTRNVIADSRLMPNMLSGLRRAGWALTGGLVIFFVGLYAAAAPELYREGTAKLFPTDRREQVKQILSKLRAALGLWLVGRFMSMAIVGVLTSIGLWLLGVPLPITLGVLAALLTFIPNIGPLLAAIPQVLLALNVGTNTALYVILFNIALQGIESYLITPMIQRHEATLPPILTISAQLLMAVLVGVIGIMMAAPLVVVAMVLVQMLYVHDRLGDRHPGQLTSS